MAGRIPQPWFWEEKQTWYVYLDGKRIRLGKDKDEAYRRFHRLMAERGREPTGSEAPPMTVAELAEQYLADMERRADTRTFYVARCYFKPFLMACTTSTDCHCCHKC